MILCCIGLYIEFFKKIELIIEKFVEIFENSSLEFYICSYML